MLAPAQSASRAKLTWEWIWRGGALADKKKSLRELGARALVLAQRAHGAADLALNSAELARTAEAARGALVASAPLESLADASTSDLYRQSAYWSLCALAATADPQAGTTYNEGIWDTLDEQLLTAAAGKDRVEALRAALRAGSFIYFAELPASEQAALCQGLRKLAESLIVKVDQPARGVQKILRQRAIRMGLLLCVLGAAGFGLVSLQRAREARNDLALSATWTTSSSMPGGGCTSPAQQCAESPGFFFHTMEEKNPWIEFDLGSEREISAVVLESRPDCCAGRGIPISVDISEDHKTWKSVARQDTDFKTWRASFSTSKARYVRLQAQKVTYLHLNRVRILP